ncbi:MAG: polyprenol monophosphomannose synthase [Gemmataceae bacterium]|nr:polyprenol monophosphomannose synthase [Gemmataceae bacterium]
MKLIVVIPTYNEAANIGATLLRVLAVDPGFHVLVVDDNSPDGTAAQVAEYARRNPRVHLLLRQTERGFGAAVRAGLVEALRLGAELVGQMDADGSHDPAMFQPMVARLERGEADLVIGSRYLSGSRIDGWGPHRYANSYVANRLAQWLTHVPVADSTNGLRLFRREVLEVIQPQTCLSRGYSVILETNYRAHRAGFRLNELPITFHPRAAGASKMGLREVVRFCWFLLRLRLQQTPAPPCEQPAKAA